jgi:two-component system, NtrC family, response regulator AtoC
VPWVVRNEPNEMVQTEPALVYAEPVNRLLVTWSDRGIDGAAPAHQSKRPTTDRGPVLRLLEDPARTQRYDRALVLSVPKGMRLAQTLADDMRPHTTVCETREVAVEDPSDYAALFKQVGAVAADLERSFLKNEWRVDVILSAGTPQAQTIWVILVQAALLHARLLQVIPAAFVPHPHPRAVREVTFDFSGFPEIKVLREEVARLRVEMRARSSSLVAESEPMRELMARVVRVAQSELAVLVLGETGSGKELVARAIHDASERASGPFVAENCSALAKSVLASELFGHEAAAFTGAQGRHRGLFEQAHGGTMFLDEVGELPPQVQAMLLRVLQEGTLRRVGGEKSIKVDVRVVAATHRDLRRMVERGKFREDLYYRLRGATLVVPPLRAHLGDLPLLIQSFLHEGRAGKRPRKLTVTPAALRLLMAYSWPGNVRELRHEVQRWKVFCEEVVDVGDLAPEIRDGERSVECTSGAGRTVRSSEPPPAALWTLQATVEAAERTAIDRALREHAGNLVRTAKALGIERNTLKRKLRALGIARPNDSDA